MRHDVFISYNSSHHRVVEPIVQWLHTQGVSTFFDEWHLLPGLEWRPALERAIGAAEGVIVFVGPGEPGSWQEREISLALDRQARDQNWPVIPVLLPGADMVRGFLSQNTWIELKSIPAPPDALARLLGAIRHEPLGPDGEKRNRELFDAICPYRGLLFFREEDAPFFHGREKAVEGLWHAIGKNSLVALVGASGSGKSSVVRAGLFPVLRSDHTASWETAILVPGDRPFHALARALMPLLEPAMSETDRLAETNKLAARLAAGEVSARDVVDRSLEKQSRTDRLILIADQLEELYTQALEDALRRLFVTRLLEVSTHPRVTVLLTIRGDFVGRALGHRDLADRLQGSQVNLGPMTQEELERAITSPAKRIGLRFEAGLVERILDDVGEEPGNLPLLEFVLKRLWEDRRGGLLRHESYREMGFLDGAIATRADAILKELSEQEQRAVRRLFLHLVHPGESTEEDTRRRATKAELQGVEPVVKRWTDERLLVTAQNLGQETIEVSHEALIRHWSTLRQWLAEDREFLLWRQRLRAHIESWVRSQRSESALLQDELLAEAELRASERSDQLTPDEREYIAEGQHLRDRRAATERERQVQALARETENRRRAEKTARILGGLSAVIGILLIGILFEVIAANRAKREAEHAQALSDFREATSRRDSGDIAGALTLFATALKLEAGSPAIRSALQATLPLARWPARELRHNSAVLMASFNRDGSRVATASWDGTVTVWDATTWHPISENHRHNRPVTRVTFQDAPTPCKVADSPSIKVVTASMDGSAIIWDYQSNNPPVVLTHAKRVTWAEFSPDGTKVVTASEDATARIWDANTGKQLDELPHTSSVLSARFSGDGKRIVTASEDETAVVWNLANGKPTGSVRLQHDAPVRAPMQSAAFSCDGSRVVTASAGLAQVWDLAGKKAGPPLQHDGPLREATFNADGTRVITTSDKAVTIWTWETGQIRGKPLLHDREILSAALSLDGTRVVTASQDHTARLWREDTGEPLGSPLQHDDWVNWAAFSHDGRTVVTASADKTARVWRTLGTPPMATVLQHDDVVSTASFGSNRNQVITASRDGTARVWNTASGMQPTVLKHEADPSIRTRKAPGLNASISQNANWILTTSSGGTARLWNGRSGHLLNTLRNVTLADFSRDASRIVIVCSDNTVQIWALNDLVRPETERSSQPIKSFHHSEAVTSATFSPDGRRVITTSEDKGVRLWDVTTGTLIAKKDHDNRVLSSAFSDDGARVVTTSGDSTARLWNGLSLAPGPVLSHEETVLSAQFAPDGSRVVTASKDSTARVWTIFGTPVGSPLRHRAIVNFAAFSPDGTRVVTASDDGSAQVWDANSGLALGPPLRHGGRVLSAKFSTDGALVLTGSRDATARVWTVMFGDPPGDSELLRRAAETLSGRAAEPLSSKISLDEDHTVQRGWVSGIEDLRKEVDSGGTSPVKPFIQWLLSDPWRRTVSPLSPVTLDEYIRERLRHACSDDVNQIFLGHNQPSNANESRFCG